ncbi:MAG: Sensor histidine kinase ResE [Chloroflexi bacterium]|nr:Sensor histidine kinase ResE [Chloroflexota bacterium]
MTSKTIACPQCRASVSPTASTCPQCGVQLALAAVLAGQSITPSRTELEKTRISPEVLVPRLGDYLIEKGFLTLADLEKALIYQKEKQAGGETILIGQVLQELGFISREELDQAVTEQIVKLQTALQKTNQDLESRVKERTAELEYAMSRLAELDPLKANFLANISHELRTPLTHLRGYIQLLADEQLGPLTPSQSNALEVMQKSESKLGNLIDDLIQFSILERSNLSLQLHKVDLLAIFKEIIPAIKAKCRENDLHCKVGIHRETPPVRADAEKLTWALQHLIDNAVKFTPDGGEVSISARVQDGEVRLSVRDTGIGIPKHRLEEIFEPFHQLDSSATRRYGGTGLGLALVQNIVEAHGSEIKVKSKEGEGTYFAFSLPIFSEE